MSDELEKGNSESQDSSREIDSVAKAILETASQGTPTVKTEQPTGQDVKQSETQPIQIDEKEFADFKKLGYTEQDLEDLELDDFKLIIENKAPKPEKVEKGLETINDPSKIIITPEMAKDHGFIKSMIGKPLTELLNAVHQQDKQIQKLRAEYNAANQKLTQTDKQKADELFTELQNTDPLDMDKDTFSKKLNDLKGYIEKGAIAPVNQPSQEEIENYFYDNLQTQLPEQVDARETAVDWVKTLSPELKEAFTKVPPQVIERAIIDFATLKNSKGKSEEATKKVQEIQKEKEKEIKISAAKQVAEALRASRGQRTQNSRFQIVKRQPESNLKDLDPTARGILEKYNEN